MGNVVLGSRIQIKLTLTYQIGNDWSWTPNVSINGIDKISDTGWIRSNNPSTYTCEGIVTDAVTIICSDESASKLNIAITELETPTSGTTDQEESETENSVYQTVTIDLGSEWRYTFTDLPLTGTDDEGNTVNYYYYIQEVSIPNYETTYSANNSGTQSGTITVTNKATENPEYTLPETGGSGTKPYTIGGLLLSVMSCLLLYIQNKRRKEENSSS